ncbi:cysteine desulfurase family protein [Lysobacter korlensis]|uniref:cysteine desulfurase n=1 Tax=Lysobacter korlensis TaxID=553636 RepID=A0ABV6RN36_9GAMM
MIYLDAAATTPVRADVLQAMWPYLSGEFGNPSSAHELGALADRALRGARSDVAAWLGARPSEIVFTASGTEADNLGIQGIALAAPRGRHVVTSAIEHPAVAETCEFLARVHGFEVTVVAVDRDGRVDPGRFRAALRPDTTLATVMLASNEIGTVQPVAELAAAAHEHGIPFHTDAVQAAGSLGLDVRELGVDALSLSGHKLGAPKGVGALFVRGRLSLEPVIHGGGQERGRRSGTENVAFAVALAAAVRGRRAAGPELSRRRDGFVDEVLRTVPGAVLTGSPADRLPGHASFCFPGTGGEIVLLELERQGILCSSGSACAAGRTEPSPVLLAIGLEPDVATTAVRFTFGDDVSDDDLRTTAAALRSVMGSITALA